MQHQTELDLESPGALKGQPDDEAVKMIQFYEPLALEMDPRGYCVCTSEGKDSRVLGHLFRRAGVKHFYLHNITGIDPPELVYFQRRNFRGYRDKGYLTYDVMYRKSIWQLMDDKCMPPLRQARYCCAELKEAKCEEQGNALVSFGVRKYESVKRSKNRDELEVVANGRRGKNLIMPYDNEDNRRTFEVCYRDAEKRLNPIAYWTDADVWNYTHEVGLEQCSLYCEGFRRLGCIGCPMATCRERQLEFERWPGFRRLYLRAFERMLQRRREKGLYVSEQTQTAEDWFDWWMSDRAQEKTDENQLALWGYEMED